jgi:hypothetical protein
MAATCIVVPNAQTEGVNEALGRLYAQSLGESYPILSRFVDGSINPDLGAATYYYTSPRPGQNGTETAFDADELVQSWLGQTVSTGQGEVTIPSSTQELEDEWFAPALPPE